MSLLSIMVRLTGAVRQHKAPASDIDERGVIVDFELSR